jgi:hypothetical protein
VPVRVGAGNVAQCQALTGGLRAPIRRGIQPGPPFVLIEPLRTRHACSRAFLEIAASHTSHRAWNTNAGSGAVGAPRSFFAGHGPNRLR